MTSIEKIIQNSTYLLDKQKEQLLAEIEESESVQTEDDYRRFLDKVLKRLLGIGTDDLFTGEKLQVNYVLQDLGVKIND